jgi:hypothetical protein
VGPKTSAVRSLEVRMRDGACALRVTTATSNACASNPERDTEDGEVQGNCRSDFQRKAPTGYQVRKERANSARVETVVGRTALYAAAANGLRTLRRVLDEGRVAISRLSPTRMARPRGWMAARRPRTSQRHAVGGRSSGLPKWLPGGRRAWLRERLR